MNVRHNPGAGWRKTGAGGVRERDVRQRVGVLRTPHPLWRTSHPLSRAAIADARRGA